MHNEMRSSCPKLTIEHNTTIKKKHLWELGVINLIEHTVAEFHARQENSNSIHSKLYFIEKFQLKTNAR